MTTTTTKTMELTPTAVRLSRQGHPVIQDVLAALS